MFCVHCGKQVPEDSLFCPFCGGKLLAENQEKEGNVSNDIPQFIAPNQNRTNEQESDRSAATAHASTGNIPQFVPPDTSDNLKSQNVKGDIPKFEPPKQSAIPTFTPPKQEHFDGPVCFHHPSERAVASCARCGKYICKDCAEAYGVVSGEFAGKHLCYDCCEQIVADNVVELTKNKNKIKAQFILQIIGMVLGFWVGFSSGLDSGDFGTAMLFGLICACIGGVFLSALKAFGSLAWDAIKIAFSGQFGWLTVLSLIFNIIVIVFKCIGVTLSNTFYYIKYLKETSGFIEKDSECLQQMRDYMEYTLVRNNNKGVDLESLMNEGSELYNNTYAQAVRNDGEQAADEMLRNATTTIAENGEIIRSFAA
jgi:hypothetical protein